MSARCPGNRKRVQWLRKGESDYSYQTEFILGLSLPARRDLTTQLSKSIQGFCPINGRFLRLSRVG